MEEEDAKKGAEEYLERHHPIGMGARLWCLLECPASLSEAALAPQPRASRDMERGSRQHQAMELRDPELSGNDFERIAVEDALAFEERFVADFGSPIEIENERRIEIKRRDGSQFTYSWSDRIYSFDDGGVIVDHKFYPASMPPDPLIIVQLFAMGVSMLQEHPEWKSVISVVYNPYLAEKREVVVKRSQLGAALRRYADAESAANNIDDYRPGAHCRYCPALGHCKAASANVDRYVELVGPVIENGPVIRIDAVSGSIEILDEDRLIDALEIVKALEEKFSRLRAIVKAALSQKDGTRIRLKSSGSTRSYLDREQAFSRLPDDVRSHLIPEVSPPKVEKAWSEARGVSAKVARQEAEAALADLLVLKPKSPSIMIGGKSDE